MEIEDARSINPENAVEDATRSTENLSSVPNFHDFHDRIRAFLDHLPLEMLDREEVLRIVSLVEGLVVL